MLFLGCNFTPCTTEFLMFVSLPVFHHWSQCFLLVSHICKIGISTLWKTTGTFQIITMAYWEDCLGKLAQHSPVLFILFACWFCYCISYCLIYSNKLRHLQRYSKSSGPPTTEKQFVYIFLIQIQIYFLQFFKVYGTAGSISKTFHPNSVVVAVLVFQARLLWGEDWKKKKKKR